MLKYTARRLLNSLVVLLCIVTITFFVTHVIPSDPAAKWAGARATPEQLEQARIELGLDQPLFVQYVDYIGRMIRGDLGRSLITRQPITSDLARHIPATLELVVLAFIFALLIGIPLGIYSAKFKDRPLDHISRFLGIGAVSLPTFWVALFLQLIFFRNLGILPIGGQLSIASTVFGEVPSITRILLLDCILVGDFAMFRDALRHLILPGITIALYPIGLVSRMTRSALLEILNEDYIIASRAYGLSELKVVWKYAMKNSVGIIATNVALALGYVLTNTFLVEAIFSWPGIGSYIATAIISMDFPAIIGVAIFGAMCYILLNFIADIIIALDPRVRL